MNNVEFTEVLKLSYMEYLNTHRRSNAKLKILHGAIANDLQGRLGDNYTVKAYGIGDGKEGKISGRYMDKRVDISVYKGNRELGGIAVKFVMTNYSQNSNNYFESMLGETANIRSYEGKAYFHILILPEKLPYFNNEGKLTKIETATSNNIDKYLKLSYDITADVIHSPNKTLLYLFKMPDINVCVGKSRDEWKTYLQSLRAFDISPSESTFEFGNGIIYNDYANYCDEIAHYLQSM